MLLLGATLVIGGVASLLAKLNLSSFQDKKINPVFKAFFTTFTFFSQIHIYLEKSNFKVQWAVG
jgi:hypothetical protein